MWLVAKNRKRRVDLILRLKSYKQMPEEEKELSMEQLSFCLQVLWFTKSSHFWFEIDRKSFSFLYFHHLTSLNLKSSGVRVEEVICFFSKMIISFPEQMNVHHHFNRQRLTIFHLLKVSKKTFLNWTIGVCTVYN